MEEIRKRRKNQRGVTLVEIMAVLIIMSLIAVAGGVAVVSIIERGRKKLTIAQIAKIKDSVSTYKLEKGSYPESLESLVPDFIDSNDNLLDGWKNEFLYVNPGDNGPFDLISGGSDGSVDTPEDNINSWELVTKDEQ